MRGLLYLLHLLRLCLLAVLLASPFGESRAADGLPVLLVLDPASARLLGSGTVIAERLVVTSRHVVEPALRRDSGLALARVHGDAHIDARVLGLSSRLDLAVLDTARPLPVRAVRATARAPISAPVTAQAPNGATLRGRVEDFRWSPLWGPATFVRLPVAFGSSGGPVVDRDGHLIGVVTAAINPSARHLAALATGADTGLSRTPLADVSAPLVLLLPAVDVQIEVARLLAACCAARLSELQWREHDQVPGSAMR